MLTDTAIQRPKFLLGGQKGISQFLFRYQDFCHIFITILNVLDLTVN